MYDFLRVTRYQTTELANEFHRIFVTAFTLTVSPLNIYERVVCGPNMVGLHACR